MKKIILSLTIVFASTAIFAQDATYKKSIKELFKLSNTYEAYDMAIEQMINMYKQQKPNIPAEVWDDMEKEFKASAKKELVDKLVPVYYKHLTQTDVDGIIAFYKSEAGKKYADKTPIITSESMEVGQAWGMQIGLKLAEKIKAGGYE